MGKEAATSGGSVVDWGAEHRSGDRLISRQAMMQKPKIPDPPEPPECTKDECIKAYIKEYIKWQQECREIWGLYNCQLNYHSARVAYAGKARNIEIPERYRTGDPMPQTIGEAIKETTLLQVKLKELEVKAGLKWAIEKILRR